MNPKRIFIDNQKKTDRKNKKILITQGFSHSCSKFAKKTHQIKMEKWENYQARGKKFLTENNHIQAIEELKKSIALKENWNTYQGLGRALFFTENYLEAIDAFNKSIALKDYWETYQCLGCTLFYKKDYPAAIKALKNSLVLKDNSITYRFLGMALGKITNYPAAVEALNKSIDLKKNWNTYLALGSVLFHMQDYTAAIEALNKSIALKENWDNYQCLGMTLYETANYPAAIEVFNKSIALKEDWNNYQSLSTALFHMKDYRKALDATNASFATKCSKTIERQFYEIYLSASDEGKVDKQFMSFFKYRNSLKEDFLKEYILTKTKSSAIDPLLLRYISLTIKNKAKETVNPIEQVLIDRLKDCNSSKRIVPTESSNFHRYVFGISHSQLHLASPNTTVISCNAGTMFSIGDPNSRAKHFQTISAALETIDHQKSILIFEFGEIDIRNHIHKISRKKSQSIFKIADISISKYIEFMNSLKRKGCNIMISGPHCGGGESLSRVSAVERNDLCAYMNDALNLECQKHGFFFLTLFDKVVDQKTLKEIPGLYSDNMHLHLPPKKIGYALNAVLTDRVNRALSHTGSQFKYFQQEDVYSDCSLVVSDITNWQTGTKFEPGEKICSKEGYFGVGKYMMLIELPFLIYPKDITLAFKHPTLKIKTAVQGILDSWDNSEEIKISNVVHAYSERSNELRSDNSIRHSFSLQNAREEMCRFLIVRISSRSHENSLTKISIKRWVLQSYRKRT